MFACLLGISAFLVLATLRAQAYFVHDDVHVCVPTNVGAIISFLAIFFFSIPLGGVMANLLMWLIPPARKALDRAEARVGQSFSKSNSELLKVAALSTLVLVPIYVIAFGSKVCLSESRIYYQLHLLAPQRTYSLSQVVEVQPRCTRASRGGWDLGLGIAMDDGASFDLAVGGPLFASSSKRILSLLRGLRVNDSQIDRSCPLVRRQEISP